MCSRDINRSPTTPFTSTSVNRASTSAPDGFDGDHADATCGDTRVPQIVVPLRHLHETGRRRKQKSDKSRHRVTSVEAPSSSANNAVSRGLLTGLHSPSLERSFTGKIRRQQPNRTLKILPSIEGDNIQHDSPPTGQQVRDRNRVPTEDIKCDYLNFCSCSGLSEDGRPGSSRPDSEYTAESRLKRKCSSSLSSSLPESPSNERRRKSIKRESLELLNPRRQREVCDGPIAPSLALSIDLQAQKLEEMGFVEVRKSDVIYSKLRRAESQRGKEIAALTEAYEKTLEQEQSRLSSHYEIPQERIPWAGESHGTPGESETDIRACKETKKPITKPKYRALAPVQGRRGAGGGVGTMAPVPRDKAPDSSYGYGYSDISPILSSSTKYDESRVEISSAEARRHNKDSQGSSSTGSKISRAFPLLKRREVRLPLGNHECDDLHQYFADPGLKAPKFERFQGSRADFLACAEHVVRCSNHNPSLIQNCRIILGTERFKVKDQLLSLEYLVVSAD